MASRPYTEVSYEPETEDEDATDNASQEMRPDPAKPRRWQFEGDMGKRIVALLAAVICVYLLYLGYLRYRNSAMSDNGAVQTDDTADRPVATAGTDETPVPKPRPAATSSSSANVSQTSAAPATDSIAPNPTNGMAFTGSGKFQVYRQGNLTWRVDTESGATCILFATMDEWRKPVVYRHACG